MPRTPALLILLALVSTLATPLAFAQDDASPDPEEPGEIVREILKLQRKIDDLMALLPLDRRAEVEELLEAHSERDDPGADVVEAVDAVAERPSPDVPEPAGTPEDPAVGEGSENTSGFGSAITVVGRDDCNLLRPFDFDDDDLISARDRYWRYLALWRDANRDGQAQETELTDLYEAGIQDLSVDLESFRYADGGGGRVDLGRFIRVGLDEAPFGDAPVLTVDTTRLARGTGPEVFRPGSDEPLQGVQPIEPGWRLRWDDGRELVLTCS